MKRILVGLFVLSLLALGYIAAPLVTAWSIREAVKNGDSEYLESKIEWDRVRGTMKASLGRMAKLPEYITADAGTGAPEQKPGLWQRFKNYLGRNAVEGFVESYVTPEGLPELFKYRKTYRRHVLGDDPDALPWHERVAKFWERVKRAEFKTPTSFEIEMTDQQDPDRLVTSLFELKGFEWRLVELHVRSKTDAVADAAGA